MDENVLVGAARTQAPLACRAQCGDVPRVRLNRRAIRVESFEAELESFAPSASREEDDFADLATNRVFPRALNSGEERSRESAEGLDR